MLGCPKNLSDQNVRNMKGLEFILKGAVSGFCLDIGKGEVQRGAKWNLLHSLARQKSIPPVNENLDEVHFVWLVV